MQIIRSGGIWISFKSLKKNSKKRSAYTEHTFSQNQVGHFITVSKPLLIEI